jgi:hypothetical protein
MHQGTPNYWGLLFFFFFWRLLTKYAVDLGLATIDYQLITQAGVELPSIERVLDTRSLKVQLASTSFSVLPHIVDPPHGQSQAHPGCCTSGKDGNDHAHMGFVFLDHVSVCSCYADRTGSAPPAPVVAEIPKVKCIVTASCSYRLRELFVVLRPRMSPPFTATLVFICKLFYVLLTYFQLTPLLAPSLNRFFLFVTPCCCSYYLCF